MDITMDDPGLLQQVDIVKPCNVEMCLVNMIKGEALLSCSMVNILKGPN